MTVAIFEIYHAVKLSSSGIIEGGDGSWRSEEGSRLALAVEQATVQSFLASGRSDTACERRVHVNFVEVGGQLRRLVRETLQDPREVALLSSVAMQHGVLIERWVFGFYWWCGHVGQLLLLRWVWDNSDSLISSRKKEEEGFSRLSSRRYGWWWGNSRHGLHQVARELQHRR